MPGDENLFMWSRGCVGIHAEATHLIGRVS